MDFVNTSGTIAQILISGTANLTGSMTATLFVVLIFLFVLCLFFGIPLEIAMIILFPIILVMASFYGGFVGIIVAIIIFFGFIIAKNFLFR
jgi:hypothetical protein